jgi:hypothetical protein
LLWTDQSALLVDMASDLLPALFGAIGTLVGGGVTLTANWIASRTQHYLVTEERKQRNAEVRRDAYSAFLASAEIFADRARELVDRISLSAPEEKITSAYTVYYEAWEDSKRKRASVLISGPDCVALSAENLRNSLTDLSTLCDSAYNQRSERTEPPRGYRGKLQAARDARANFASIARKYAVVGESDLTANRKRKSIRKAGESNRPEVTE